MVRIAPIRLAYNPKTLWFDPGDLELKKEDPVVVSTARGLEFGRMADDVFEAADELLLLVPDADAQELTKLRQLVASPEPEASSEDEE